MKNLLLTSMLGSLLLFGCKKEPEERMDTTQSPMALCGPVTTDQEWYQSDKKAPLIGGLDVLDFQITTKDSLVQAYFNQGLVLAYGFNHAEAARSFYYARKLDPDCAMAYWGYAYVLGPNYNAGMEPDNYERAYKAVQKALRLVEEGQYPEKEGDLIRALANRYQAQAPEDRSNLDQAYAQALGDLCKKYPEDADIATMYAEALMDMHPWDLYDKQGKAKAWTPEILKTLDRAIEINPQHCGAHHLYIHAVEASNQPEKALKSAQVFDEDLVPGAGHLIHMPSHVYIRTGDYHKGTVSNIRAVKVDSIYVTTCHAQGAYPLAYFPHNYHFMAATATLEGNSQWAILAANKVASQSNIQLMKEPGWGTIQHYYTTPYYIYAKFGKWEEILEAAPVDSELKYPQAIRHYAQGLAFLGLANIEKAKKELAFLAPYLADESLKEITIWDINSVYELLQIAHRVLAAEIKAQEENYEASIELLKEAIAIEDQLNYNEPPDWFFSVRHHLGQVQLAAKKYEDAMQTYQEDLDRLPKNGWALHGLKAAYEGLSKVAKVQEVEEKLALAWATADVELNGSKVK